MEVDKTAEPTTGPKEKQMSATQMAHEIMSGGKTKLCGCYMKCYLFCQKMAGKEGKGLWTLGWSLPIKKFLESPSPPPPPLD